MGVHAERSSLLHVSFKQRGNYFKNRNNEGVKMPALMVHMNKGPVFMTINTELPETKDICRCAVHYVVKYLFKLLTRTKKKKKEKYSNKHPD